VLYFPVLLSLLTFLCYFCFLYNNGHSKGVNIFINSILKNILRYNNDNNHIDTTSTITSTTTSTTTTSTVNNKPNSISQHDIINDIQSSSNPMILWPILSLILKDNYPYKTSLLTLLEKWRPNNLNKPNRFVEVLQHYDYNKIEQRRASIKYRNNGLPYKLYNIPDIIKCNKLWTNEYLSKNINDIISNGEVINDERTSGYNHTYNKILYGTIKMNKRKHVITPLVSAAPHITFNDFLDLSKTNNTEYYYMIKSPPKDSTSFIAKDLQIWSSSAENYFITNPQANHGIKCRIGMKGGMIEAHYNTARNLITSIKGVLRVVLFPTSKCPMLINNTTRIIRRNNIIDWNNLEDIKKRGFDSIPSLETLILPGEVLHVPPFWLHTIVSLESSIECNLIINNPTTVNTYFSLDHCIK